MTNMSNDRLSIPVIALTGHIGAGKSTFAERLMFQRLNPRGLHLPFAFPVKLMLAMGNPCAVLEFEEGRTLDFSMLFRLVQHVNEMKNETVIGTDHSVRYGLETLGTEWGRNLMGNNIWTAQWQALVQYALSSGVYKYIIVDDMRFPNELEHLRANFSRVLAIRVYRDVIVGANDPVIDHESKRYIDELNVDFQMAWMTEGNAIEAEKLDFNNAYHLPEVINQQEVARVHAMLSHMTNDT